ncbi:MAG: GntR family transcriptional regulator, partial [Lachnospiraceae bacterium]|nr:GntR family transcriptional regulator [Lachnospiraceae bacterium]
MLNTQPVYLQLADLLQEKIDTSEYGPGSNIPSERELTESFGISRMTVRKAINVLIDRGMLTRIQGKGTFVRAPRIDSPLDVVQSMGKFIQELGLLPSNKVLFCGKRKAGIKYSRVFKIDPEDDIFQLFRVRLGSDDPIALEYTYVPYSVIPELET